MKPNSISARFRQEIGSCDPLIIQVALLDGRPTAPRRKCRQILAEIVRRELRRPYSSGPAIARELGCSEKTVYRLAKGQR